MLDDVNVLKQRDPHDALGVAADQWQQVEHVAEIIDSKASKKVFTNIVVAGMGGSALAAELVKVLLEDTLEISFDVIREYDLPAYVNKSSLVIASSYSGNTEETLSCYKQAEQRGAALGVVAAGGKLAGLAEAEKVARVIIPSGIQPRMAMLYNLRALLLLLNDFGVVNNKLLNQVEGAAEWLLNESKNWLPTVPTAKNLAKQIALQAMGKTPVFYGGRLTGPVAYKWKISWNENAKNVSFWNVYPESNHNEFVGWASHPVEKPFAVFDLLSSFEHPRILRRFEVSDRLLSGLRPKSMTLELTGDSLIKQLLRACILADFASIYVAILNGVDPTPVDLVEKLKLELSK